MLSKLLAAVLILSFLNIGITETGCSIWDIWAAISVREGSSLFTKVASYLGILLLLFSVLVKSRFTLNASWYGIVLLWGAVATFYPYYWDIQRYDWVNPQYLFILSTAIQMVMNLRKAFYLKSTVKQVNPALAGK